MAKRSPATPNKPASAGNNELREASAPPATRGEPNTKIPRSPLASRTMSDQPRRESVIVSMAATAARIQNIHGEMVPSNQSSRLTSGRNSSPITTTPNTRPATLPPMDNWIASMPCPFLTSRCPGNSANPSSPGTPRNRPGTTSKNVWEMASAQVKASNAENSTPNEAKPALPASSSATTVLTWMPGIRPVITPNNAPTTVASSTMEKGLAIISVTARRSLPSRRPPLPTPARQQETRG